MTETVVCPALSRFAVNPPADVAIAATAALLADTAYGASPPRIAKLSVSPTVPAAVVGVTASTGVAVELTVTPVDNTVPDASRIDSVAAPDPTPVTDTVEPATDAVTTAVLLLVTV